MAQEKGQVPACEAGVTRPVFDICCLVPMLRQTETVDQFHSELPGTL